MLRPGQTLRDYRLLERVGRGGQGEMWLAVKVDASGVDFKRFAIKVLLPELVEDDEFVRLFVGEARLAAKLEHPNVVQVFESGDFEDRIWFSQEYVDGYNLRDIRRAAPGGIPYALVAFIIGEILEALVYAHEMCGGDGQPLRIVHRDIKPSNVMVASLGHVKLADFGIAKRLDEAGDGGGLRTKTGQVKGTIGYMAPELLLGARASHVSDLYAVGIVMWELLTGRRLFAGEDVLRKNIEAQVPSLRSMNVNVPVEFERVLLKLLNRDPAARFRTAQVAQHALRGAPGGRDAAAAELRSYLGTLMQARQLISESAQVADRATREFQRTMVEAARKAANFAKREERVPRGGTGSASMGLSPAGPSPVVSGVLAPAAAMGSSPTAPTVAGQLASRSAGGSAWRRAQIVMAVVAAIAVGVMGALLLSSGRESPASARTATFAPADAGLEKPPEVAPGVSAPAPTPTVASPPENVEPDSSTPDAGAEPSSTTQAKTRSRRAIQLRAPGRLEVQVVPWADVYIDGRRVGPTPLTQELAPGKHRVKLVNEELHQEKSMTVTVTSGTTSVLEHRW